MKHPHSVAPDQALAENHTLIIETGAGGSTGARHHASGSEYRGTMRHVCFDTTSAFRRFCGERAAKSIRWSKPPLSCSHLSAAGAAWHHEVCGGCGSSCCCPAVYWARILTSCWQRTAPTRPTGKSPIRQHSLTQSAASSRRRPRFTAKPWRATRASCPPARIWPWFSGSRAAAGSGSNLSPVASAASG